MHGAFGKDEDLPSLIYRYVTQMQNPKQICRIHENEKKRMYNMQRVADIEQGTFTPLIFTMTGGMGEECEKYHSRLTELIATKKGERYSKTISWIRAKSFHNQIRSSMFKKNENI